MPKRMIMQSSEKLAQRKYLTGPAPPLQVVRKVCSTDRFQKAYYNPIYSSKMILNSERGQFIKPERHMPCRSVLNCGYNFSTEFIGGHFTPTYPVVGEISTDPKALEMHSITDVHVEPLASHTGNLESTLSAFVRFRSDSIGSNTEIPNIYEKRLSINTILANYSNASRIDSCNNCNGTLAEGYQNESYNRKGSNLVSIYVSSKTDKMQPCAEYAHSFPLNMTSSYLNDLDFTWQNNEDSTPMLSSHSN